MTVRAVGELMSRFAHLTGGIAAKGKAEDDEEKRKREEEEARAEDDEEKRKREEEEARAAEEEEREREEEEARADDGDDEASKKARSIRKSERARCAAILGHPAAAHNIALAAELATGTDLPVKAAIALLKAGSVPPVRQSAGLAARMAGTPRISIGAETTTDQPRNAAEEARALASTIVASARAAGVIRK